MTGKNMLLIEALLLSATWHTVSTAADTSIDFEKQIAPIFADHCVRCHSPGDRKGDVSLATIADLRAGEYVIAGDPDNSHLMHVVTSSDGEPAAMPKEGRPLSKQERQLLSRWIAEGADWPKDLVVRQQSKADESWWSLQPLQTDFEATNIDSFVREKLDKKGLQLSPRAGRRTLIRRLSFDLHGLPPSPEAVETFVNDDNPRAWENLVDRMLASPAYGERFAQHWLDLAHYADTHGFERDKRRDNAWRYRDYVIQALNEDKPYNQFLQEQIAGDVLWPDDEQAIVATGYLAAGPWDFVGQVETKSLKLRRSARSLDLDDMATQVMTSTMAMTVNCARCHDHKLDPITQREYYQLRSVFAGIKREDRTISELAQQKYETQKRNLTSERNKLDFRINRLEGNGPNLADIVGGGNGFGTGTYRSAIDVRTAKVQTRDFGALGNVKTNSYRKSAFDFVDGVFVPDGEHGKAQIPVSSTGLTISGLPKTSGAAWDMIRNGPVASQHSTELGGIDFAQDNHTLLGLHANAGITFDLQAIRKASQLKDLRFTAKLGYFGAIGANRADAWVLLDGEKAAEFRHLQRKDGLQEIDINIAESIRFLTLIATDGENGYGHDQIGFGDPQLKAASLKQLTPDVQNQLARLRQERQAVIAKFNDLGSSPEFYGVVALNDVPEIRLLNRGNPESPVGTALAPAAVSALSMLQPELGTQGTPEGDRRAALAKWITHPSNPLMARVIANRLWHWHFGMGIVSTPNDFGYGGGRPSHPELLDWLATQLPRHNWSLKAMHRLILTSDAYQQKSVHQNNNAMAIDSDNRLLWRQNPRRIEAEAIRDAVLFVSGQLNTQRGGPGFEDFEYKDAYAPIYTYVTADKPALWRRSIYRYIVRTTPNRFLTTLDCPDPANFTAKRLTTTTPLQSLALYNNDFMLSQANYFAKRIKQKVGDKTDAEVQQAFLLAFARVPTDRERVLAADLVETQGLFALCRSLFNANEFVYVD